MTADPAMNARKAKHAVIVAHPDADSFTMAVARAYSETVAARGQVAVLRDLYRLGFDPVLKAAERPTGGAFTPSPDVAAELEELRGADIFVLVYPIWFGAPPAMIKGYIERVFGAGFSGPTRAAHLHKPTHELLGGKQLLTFTSSGSTKDWLDAQGAWLSLQTIFDGYLARTFWMDTPDHVHFESIFEGVDENLVHARVEEARAKAVGVCARLARELARPA
ncbi:NAD(P)H-dependent oxidoreductase [Allosphingosinicella sp.]|uniref:NAD(P)H-dependent oxidoreductase n=1 Tax=Allosphingosinicella sp. TaxID=2823234 RepID=UPI003783D5E3